MGRRRRFRFLHAAIAMGLALPGAVAVLAATSVPTEVQQPGTQPGEVASFVSPAGCDNCHDSASGTQDRQLYPSYGWRGGMMANASRDPLMWATLAVAEQDFLPGSDPDQRGGAGDFCLRCHAPNGWISGRSTPTDGRNLSSAADTNGVECELCHLLVNPDQPVNVPGTTEAYHAPFEAYESSSGEPHRGSGQYVLNGNGTRLGPYANVTASHTSLQSSFHRQSELCGTCHDVSNPVVADLAPNNGAQVPLPASSFSGVPGSPITGKAAFNNPPYAFGVVERTYSEWKASAFDDVLVNDYGTLPSDLRVAGGALDVAYHRAFDARADANYEDGTLRYFTCQTCHMSPATGVGSNRVGTPTRTDLPRHDHTGGAYWMPDAILWQNDHGTLRFGSGLTSTQSGALAAGKARAGETLQTVAELAATQTGHTLLVRVTNLTGHKLITGYPEGRRMWINIRWKDTGGELVREDGAYGLIGRTVNDLAGTPHQVESLLDPEGTILYEVNGGINKDWAARLLTLGHVPNLALSYDRMTDAAEHTLGQLSSAPAGTAYPSFHFVLNNTVIRDNRIPPYGFTYDEARVRNCLPVPSTRFGAPGPGGTYRHWDEVPLTVPPRATTAEIRLQYQQTSWEYIQFLWLQNDGLNTFLGAEGVRMLDAWLNTGMSPPFTMAMTTVPLQPVAQAVSGLILTDSSTLVWSSVAGASRYDVMRGSLASLLVNRSIGDASCLADDLTPASVSDPAVPPAGAGFYYLVRADGAGLIAGSYDNPPAVASPDEGRDAEVGTAGGAGCSDLP